MLAFEQHTIIVLVVTVCEGRGFLCLPLYLFASDAAIRRHVTVRHVSRMHVVQYSSRHFINHTRSCYSKKLSCRRETARCSESFSILLSHSMLLEMVYRILSEMKRDIGRNYSRFFSYTPVFNAPLWGACRNFAITFRTKKLELWVLQSEKVWGYTYSLFVSIEYMNVTDR